MTEWRLHENRVDRVNSVLSTCENPTLSSHERPYEVLPSAFLRQGIMQLYRSRRTKLVRMRSVEGQKKDLTALLYVPLREPVRLTRAIANKSVINSVWGKRPRQRIDFTSASVIRVSLAINLCIFAWKHFVMCNINITKLWWNWIQIFVLLWKWISD